MWHYGIWSHSPLTSVGVVHSTWPSQTTWHTHAPTFDKWHKKKNKNEKVTLHILTHDAMWRCGSTSLTVCLNDKIHGMRKRNVTIRSEIWTTNTRMLGFRDSREWVLLWGLILRSLGCTAYWFWEEATSWLLKSWLDDPTFMLQFLNWNQFTKPLTRCKPNVEQEERWPWTK